MVCGVALWDQAYHANVVWHLEVTTQVPKEQDIFPSAQCIIVVVIRYGNFQLQLLSVCQFQELLLSRIAPGAVLSMQQNVFACHGYIRYPLFLDYSFFLAPISTKIQCTLFLAMLPLITELLMVRPQRS